MLDEEIYENNDEYKQLKELKEFGLLSEEDFREKLRILIEIIKDPNYLKKKEENEIFEWVNKIIEKYNIEKVNNIEVDFENGIVLIALLNNFNPKLIKFKKNKDSESNKTLCFMILSKIGFPLNCKVNEFGIDYSKTLFFLKNLIIFFENKKFELLNDIDNIIKNIKENNEKFKEIDLRNQILTERQMKQIFKDLETNTNVTSLLLSNTNINDTTIRSFIIMIKNNKCLST
jgi:hypothetical protein